MFLPLSVAGELLNVLLLRFFSIPKLCALSLTDDISDSLQGPQFVKLSVRYFYISLKKNKKKRIYGIIRTSSLPHNIHTSRFHFKTQLSVQKWDLKPTESEKDHHKGSCCSVLKFDVAQKMMFYARGFFPN